MPEHSPASYRFVTLISLLALTLSGALFAQEPYTKGSVRGSVIAGAGSTLGDDYVILGIGAGYFVIDGLEIGLNWQSWLGGDPSINQITPEITYVIRTQSRVAPYIGALYRRTFVSGAEDLSAYGGRAGINMSTGDRSFIGIGGVYLKYTDCKNVFGDCTSTYPELTFGFSF